MAVARALCSVLVGRTSELSELEDALLSALRGEGSVVVLGGEAGMGKTRLARELTRRARSLGCVVMSGACSEAELALPYLPFLEAIGNHLAVTDAEALRAALGSGAAELAQLFPQLGEISGGGGDSVQSKLRLFEAMLMLLRLAAGGHGLLLVLEDLHWADPATRELVDYMTRRLRGTNVLVLATYRSEELHRKHALLPTIQGWRRSGSVRVIEVAALTPAGVGDMLCAIFDQSEVSTEFSEFMRERAEGNPFVLEEMLKEAIDRGDIFRTAEGWDRKAIRELRVPPTVRDSILLRLERLDPRDADVLGAAAVAGRSFDADLLAAVAQLPVSDVLDSLQRCVLHQLVEEDTATPGSFHFRHALTREAIYEDMVTPRRQVLHGRVVDRLLERGRPAVELAHHLLLARRDAEAVARCLEAARDACRTRAYGDAAELLERALPLVDEVGERGHVSCLAGDAYWNGSQPLRARHLLEAGIQALEEGGRNVEAADWRVLLGRCHWETQRSDLALSQFEAARQTLEPLGPSEALANLYIRLGGLGIFANQPLVGLDWARRAAEVAEAAGATRALAWAWAFEASALQMLGQVEAGNARAAEAFAASVAGGFWFQAGNTAFNACWTAIHLGLTRLARHWERRVKQEVPVGAYDAWVGYLDGLCRLQEGDVAGAAETARAGVERWAESEHGKTVWRLRVLHAQALAELDRGAEAAAELPPVSSRVDPQDQAYDGAARIRTALAGGQPEAALEAAAALEPAACNMGSPADAAAVVLVPGRPEAMRELFAGLPSQGEIRALPRFRVVEGAAALAAGRPEAGRAILEEALAAMRAEGSLLDAWHGALLLARARAAAGAPDAARETLLGVVQEAGAAGGRLVARLAFELAQELGLDVAAPAPAGVAPAPAGPAPESGPSLAGERLVTVLFADVRGYTRASAASAPAEVADRIGTLQRLAAGAVAEHHGVLDKFAGDAVMATFNVSGATVDHAQHAVECAIEIVQKAALAGLPVGAGVATGPAIVGRFAPGSNLSVLGEATNLAARLQAASGAGELTVSGETRRRLADDWPGERLALDLKGFEEPVSAFRLRVG